MLGVGGATLANLDIKWTPGSSACVVLASEGYPQKPRTGDVIKRIDEAAAVPNVQIFHAGTSLSADGKFTTPVAACSESRQRVTISDRH